MKHIFILIIFLNFTYIVNAVSNCPVCKGKLVILSKQKDDRTKPSKNLSVWNRSICANRFFGEGSLICLKDYYAFDETMMKHWKLSLENKNGFAHPLTKKIYNFPIPEKKNIKSSLVYSQEFKTLKSVEHSLLFWSTNNAKYLKLIKIYAENNKLELDVSKHDAECFIRVKNISKAKP